MTDTVRRTSTPRSELERTAWPQLSDDLVEVLRESGTERDVQPGDVLFEVGQDSYDLLWIEQGSVQIVDRTREQVVVTIEAPNLVGELGMLMGQGTFLAAEACEPSRVIVVPQRRVLELVATVPELSDVIVTAFAARRRLLIEWGEGGLVIVGSQNDAGTRRLLQFAGRSKLPHRFVDRADAAEVTGLDVDLPDEGAVAVTGRAGVLVDPAPRDLAKALGLDLEIGSQDVFDLVVVGAGPGGLAAAVYGASEGLRTLVVDDTAIGGQAGTSSRIENYLGFSTGSRAGSSRTRARCRR